MNQANRTKRKPGPIVITTTVLLMILVVYFGAFYANLKEREVIAIYRMPHGTETWREPQYRIADALSETVFWPADSVDGLLRGDYTLEQVTNTQEPLP